MEWVQVRAWHLFINLHNYLSTTTKKTFSRRFMHVGSPPSWYLKNSWQNKIEIVFLFWSFLCTNFWNYCDNQIQNSRLAAIPYLNSIGKIYYSVLSYVPHAFCERQVDACEGQTTKLGLLWWPLSFTKAAVTIASRRATPLSVQSVVSLTPSQLC